MMNIENSGGGKVKIGIVTFQRADNHGALLQCYALYTYLKNLEPDVEVIDYRNSKIEKVYKIFPIMRNIKAMYKRWKKGMLLYGVLKKRHSNFERLREKINFSLSVSCDNLKNKKNDYDLIITGSDQVWNTDITRGFDDIYYLNFPGSYVKASYAASIGNTANPDFCKDYFKDKLYDFDALSVRERDAAQFISDMLSEPVVQCVDPTLLIGRSEWKKIADEAMVSVPQRYILLYYVQPNKELIKIAEKIAKERDIPVFCFEKDIYPDCNTVCDMSVGPMEFVKLIKDAEVVVTSSFHAMAFSCIFEKDIYSIAHSVTGARVVSLAEMFGIEHRIYKSYSDFESRYVQGEKLEYSRENYFEQYKESENYIKSLIGLVGGSFNE